METGGQLTADAKIDLLHQNELLAELDPAVLGQIAELAREFQFPAGHYLVRQGDLGTGFYVLVSGRVEVIRNGERVDEMGPSESFGELSILDHGPRTASIRAITDVRCLALASWELTPLLEQQPRVTLALLRQVVRRLRPHLTSHRH